MTTISDNQGFKREELKEFFLSIKNCSLCDLHITRTNFVFGSGNSSAGLLFIGEAPGKNEDLQGKPFVGQAGRILDELLAGIGLKREDVFIANVLKCRPPANRDPNIGEIDTCKQYLFRQIEIIDPKIICTLGKYSTQLLLDTTAGISGLRGRVFEISGRYILPINHPAAALYTPSRMELLREDFRKARGLLDSHSNTLKGNITDIKDGITDIKDNIPVLKEEVPADSEQLGLF